MLCGYPDPRINSNDYPANPNVTVLEWLNGRPGFEGRVAAYGAWNRLSRIVNRERSKLPVFCGWEPIESFGGVPLSETYEAFFRLRDAGKIADFGVSNFDTDDMEEAATLDKGLTGSDQVLYCLSRRGPEYDLLPWLRQRSIPLMAYSPLDQGRLLGNAMLKKLAGDLRCTPAQLALAWVLAQPGVVTIPKSMTRERVKENLGAVDIKLSPDVLAELDRAFPPPKRKQALGML